MAIELVVKQKKIRQAIRGSKGEVLMTVNAEPVTVSGVALMLHDALTKVGGVTQLAPKGGFQLTEPRTGHKFCGGERVTKLALMGQAEALVKREGLEGIEARVQKHLAAFDPANL